MKQYRTLIIVMLMLHALVLSAQSNKTAGQQETATIHINQDFLKELEQTFTLAPKAAPIQPPVNDVLTREQLREWVGEPKVDVPVINIHGLTDHGFAKGIVLSQSKNGKYTVMNTGDGHCVISGLDVNALGKYIRPEEIHLRQMRELADRYRETMDKYYPMEGAPLWAKEDAAQLAGGQTSSM